MIDAEELTRVFSWLRLENSSANEYVANEGGAHTPFGVLNLTETNAYPKVLPSLSINAAGTVPVACCRLRLIPGHSASASLD